MSDHGRHRTRRPWILGIAGLVVLAAIGLLGLKAAGLLSGSSAPADYSGSGQGSVSIQVLPGQTSYDFAGTLKDAGVVASRQALINAAIANAQSKFIQPCTYTLKKEMKASLAIAYLADPTHCANNVTVQEGWRTSQVVDAVVADVSRCHKYPPVGGVAQCPKITRDGMRAVLASGTGLGLPASAHDNPEGYLYPATYSLGPSQTATGLFKEMVATGTAAYAKLNLVKGAQALRMTPHEILTVASIIQWEARKSTDFPKVARAIYNRLKIGMPLQSDATVSFANGVSGRLSTTDAERANPSPYNTYVHQGLPPGPIGSPGAEAIKAALNPVAGPWLYWVVVNPNTGESVFSTTFAEHQRAVAQFQAYCRQHTC